MEFSHRLGVDIVEQCQVSPPPGSVPSHASFPLAFFDMGWLSLPPVRRLFFYEYGLSKTDFLNTTLPTLKHSLSLTLQHFFPLAGNLTWPHTSTKPEMLYTQGNSVTFTVAESGGDFHHLLGNHLRDCNLFFPLIPELPRDENSDIKLYPVLALQVTLFPGNGICIGVTYHHSVADGRILIHFVKSWASVCRGDPPVDPLLCYDRSLVIDKLGIYMFQLDKLKKANITKDSFNLPNYRVSPTQDKVLATQIIRPCDVTRIKRWILARLENQKRNDTPLHLSTFVITCAYVWACLVRATWGEAAAKETGYDLTEYFLLSADCRARRKPPLPATYFGNCLTPVVIKVKRSDLIAPDGVAIAAELIGNAIQNGNDGDGLMDVEFPAAKDRLLSVAGATKLGVYETEFGWGKLRKAEVPSVLMTRAMSLCECPDEAGAMEVGLAHSKNIMEAFTSLFANTLQNLPSY